MASYVTSFPGRRDDYQIPIALAENGRLDRFITDIYSTPSIRRLAEAFPESVKHRLDFRRHDALPPEKISCLWSTAALERLRQMVGVSPSVAFSKLDKSFSEAAASRARKTRSNLILYEPYAWEAFSASYKHDPYKVAFYFHPHCAAEQRILDADLRKWPQVAASYAESVVARLPPVYHRRIRDAWRAADVVLCASSFTRQTLIDAGVDEKNSIVIPYGVARADACLEVGPVAPAFQALFVGSGIQRKGLHHLLWAWERARLPNGSRLILVCRNIDRGIRQMIPAGRGVTLIEGVLHAELRELFCSSSLLVMPSLVEGFGQVYLEAMSCGCPVLGTRNTALPDIMEKGGGAFCVDPGNCEELVARLEELCEVVQSDSTIRAKALACAEHFTWEEFRSRINQALR